MVRTRQPPLSAARGRALSSSLNPSAVSSSSTRRGADSASMCSSRSSTCNRAGGAGMKNVMRGFKATTSIGVRWGKGANKDKHRRGFASGFPPNGERRRQRPLLSHLGVPLLLGGRQTLAQRQGFESRGLPQQLRPLHVRRHHQRRREHRARRIVQLDLQTHEQGEGHGTPTTAKMSGRRTSWDT